MQDISVIWHIILFVSWFVVNFTFTLFWGHGAMLRAILFFFGIPADVAISSLLTSSIASRITSLSVLHKKKLIDRKISWVMIIVSLISGVLTTYVLLLIDGKIIEFFVGLMLLWGSIWYLVKKYIPLPKKIDFTRYLWNEKKSKLFYLFIILITDTLATITWWIWLLSVIILRKYFHKTFQEAAAALKIGWLFKSVIVAWWLIMAWKYNIPILLTIIPAWALWGYLGTHYFANKEDKTLESLMCFVSLVMWFYLIFKHFYF